MSHHFGHREHVRLAFDAVREHGMPGAVDVVCAHIRAVTAHAPQKYHYTVSRAWVELVAYHSTVDSTFDELVNGHPALLDKRLLSRHYRSSTLASEAARTGWVPPDLTPFPWTSTPA